MFSPADSYTLSPGHPGIERAIPGNHVPVLPNHRFQIAPETSGYSSPPAACFLSADPKARNDSDIRILPSPAHISPKKLSLLFILLAAGAGSALAQPKVIAHRGYWKAPNSAQNSLASFSKADSIGVFASEIDVWLTADDRLIVNHDRVFKGTDINMERSTQRDICNIVLANGENIPTLDAYLKLVTTKPDTRLVLEMKSLSDLSREDLAAEKIVKALRKYGLVERTDIIAFSLNACLAFKKLLPDSKIYYLDGDLTPKKIKKLGLAGIDYSIEALRKHPEWVEQAHKLGLEVNVWTVDKEEDMRYFIDLGVDYITTNYPEQLQQLIGEK